MFSIEIWYLWYIQYVLYNSHTPIFRTKIVYILCKFYPVRSFDYSWSNNLVTVLCSQWSFFIKVIYFYAGKLNSVLLLRHSLVNISIKNFDKVISVFFSQSRTNVKDIRWLNFHFQPISTLKPQWVIDNESVQFYQRYCNFVLSTLKNVDKHMPAQFSFSTKC